MEGWLVRLLTRLYALLIRLYPPSFRAEFADEMQVVFTEAMAEAAERGKLPLAVVCWREMRDWPITLVRECCFSFKHRRKDVKMSAEIQRDILGEKAGLTQTAQTPWRDAVLAGLPHLLVTLFAGVSQVAYGLLPGYIFDRLTGFFAVFGVAFFILAGGVVLYAWRHGWPLWTASWYGYGAWLVLIALVPLGLLNEKLGIIEAWKFNNALILGGIGLMGLGYLWLVRRDWLQGLLAALFFMPMMVLMMTIEFVHPQIEGLVFVVSGLLAALASGAIVCLRSWQVGVWLVFGINLLAGAAISYVSVYQIDIPAQYFSPTPSAVVTRLTAYLLLSLALVAGPFLLWALWRLGKHSLVGKPD